ncbi:hypothetical protein Shyd_88440 [Streptomyces hydrogenans]|uniref:Uncharacterized protein n=1 Tax=Streptomyces hydrogenans TaxID=1873719 RepID=A0ABQ3PR26_9ACTN|nr:hypothetical protein GCM10018784_08720 [Streptomyces hydrogenans]GHI27473.1 hypothetical protein Shyd_88440 [Streptomyces hydrogenans]
MCDGRIDATVTPPFLSGPAGSHRPHRAAHGARIALELTEQATHMTTYQMLRVEPHGFAPAPALPPSRRLDAR